MNSLKKAVDENNWDNTKKGGKSNRQIQAGLSFFALEKLSRFFFVTSSYYQFYSTVSGEN